MILDDEKKIVEIMIKQFCYSKHGKGDKLCEKCEGLLEYSNKRLDSCKFGNNKGSCGKCKVHCYKSDMRKRIIEVMRFSGMRMLYNHPILAFRHLLQRLKRPC